MEVLLRVKWYAVVNDVIGGWAISNVDKTCADLDHTKGEYELGCFLSQEIAEHIVKVHNESIGVD